VLWGLFELRAGAPMVDLRISARPAVLLTNVAALLVGFSFMASSLATAQLIQEPKSTGYGLGMSILASGLVGLPGGLAMAAFSPISARISVSRGPKTTVALACCVMALGYLFRVLYTRTLIEMVIGTIIVSVGTALAYSALPILIMRAVPASETGAATGLNTLMRTVGQSFCSAVIAAVLTTMTITVAGEQFPAERAYVWIWGIAGAGAVVGLLVTLCIPSRRQDDAVAQVADVTEVDAGGGASATLADQDGPHQDGPHQDGPDPDGPDQDNPGDRAGQPPMQPGVPAAAPR
jgi:MFS family permease